LASPIISQGPSMVSNTQQSPDLGELPGSPVILLLPGI
jgi:hypothetical protein